MSSVKSTIRHVLINSDNALAVSAIIVILAASTGLLFHSQVCSAQDSPPLGKTLLRIFNSTLPAHETVVGGHSRPLSVCEVKYAKRIFGKAIDYRNVRIVRGSLVSLDVTRAIGNSIFFAERCFTESEMELSIHGQEVLIHELTHVLQFQTTGWDYAQRCLTSQLYAFIKTGSRHCAYDWEFDEKQRLPPGHWNPEQQAEIMEDYNKLLCRKERGQLLLEADNKELKRLKSIATEIISAYVPGH
jgi:hypothetical protein